MAPTGARLEKIQARDFEGKQSTTSSRKFTVNMTVENRACPVKLVEWPLRQDFDGILGQSWLSRENPDIDWSARTVSWRRRTRRNLPREWTPPHSNEPTIEYDVAEEFQRNLKSGLYAEVYHLDVVADNGKVKPDADVSSLIREFADSLRAELPEGLPPERDIEHSVQLKQGAVPASRPRFRQAHVEKAALKFFVDKLLHKKWIERSSSPWVSNIFAVPKRDTVTGQLPTKTQWVRGGDPSKPVRWVIDYRYVNSATNIPRIPIPRINEIFDRLAGAHVFTLIDLALGYHQMRMAFDSRQFTAFHAGSEIYQWCVASMGLAGMPVTWSRLMRRIFENKDLAGFIVVFLDDICVFSKNRTEHLQHLRRVLEILRSEQLLCETQ